MDPRLLLRKILPTARRLLVERSLSAIDWTGYSRILVAGAGFDPYRRLFLKPKLYVTADIVSYAGQTDVLADVQKLPFQSGSFDCVLASELVEHLIDSKKFIDEARRVLSVGGHLVMTVPFMYHTHADPCDYSRPTLNGLEVLLSEFSSVKISSQGGRVAVISDLITTVGKNMKLLVPFRIVNHIIVRFYSSKSGLNKTTAPSGYLIVAKK